MEAHISVVAIEDETGREHTYLRVSQPNEFPFERKLSPYELTILSVQLSIALKRELEYKEYEYHHED